MTAQSIYCKPRTGFLFFLLSCPQLTERISPPPASSATRIIGYSKQLLKDAAGKRDTPVCSPYNEFSVRNTALANSTGVKRLYRVPGQSIILKKLLLSPDIADHACEHQHRSPPPRLHSPRTVTPLPSPGLASASGAAAAAAGAGDRLSATAVKFPRASRRSRSPPRGA